MKQLICLLILINLITSSSYTQNNTISIKKKITAKSTSKIEGLYYSSYVIENVETNNKRAAFKQIRHYVYFINRNEVCLFSSNLSPQKISKKLNKKGVKIADEIGKWSISDNDIYFEVNTLDPKHSKSYRYVAKLINEEIYLSYKAEYRKKTALDIYLYKYETPLDI